MTQVFFPIKNGVFFPSFIGKIHKNPRFPVDFPFPSLISWENPSGNPLNHRDPRDPPGLVTFFSDSSVPHEVRRCRSALAMTATSRETMGVGPIWPWNIDMILTICVWLILNVIQWFIWFLYIYIYISLSLSLYIYMMALHFFGDHEHSTGQSSWLSLRFGVLLRVNTWYKVMPLTS